MNRRELLRHASAAMLIPFFRVPPFLRNMRMGIVVHSYGHRWHSQTPSTRYPGFRDAMDLLQHCHDIGSGGVQVMVNGWSTDFAKAVRDKREKLELYLEGSIALPRDKEDVARFDKEVVAAREAGAAILRTVCLNGRRYENFKSAGSFDQFRQQSVASLQLAESVVARRKMKLAIENHKDWQADELLELIQPLNSEWIGVNLDFGNNVALMEDPMEVVRKLAPFTFTTHVKDMGVKEYDDGFLLSEVPLGNGFLDLNTMFELCRKKDASMHFNLEMITRDPLEIPCLKDDFWATFTRESSLTLARTLRRVRDNTYDGPLPEVSTLDSEQQLAVEEENIVLSLAYGRNHLGLD